MKRFPEGFLWGASASSYQIEGAVGEDGRGPSIWDTFSAVPGNVVNGDTGEIACDHYHRYPEDVALLKRMGARAYRFSVAWPRIQPDGTGPANPQGLAFYDRLVDALLEAGIEPWMCLYHWDLPQALEDRGGWRNRDSAAWFGDYAQIVMSHLSDRVRHVVPTNEPNVVVLVGYIMGAHAPGRRSRQDAVAAIHHLNLAHGEAVAAARSIDPGLQVGPVVSMAPVVPAADDPHHADAAQTWNGLWNRAFTDPMLSGQYPPLLTEEIAPFVQDGDLERISAKTDFFGLNHYCRMYAAPDPDSPFGVGMGPTPPGLPLTDMGWEIDPEAFHAQLVELRDRYGNPPVYVTENGAAFPDPADADGRVLDDDRVAFFEGYLSAMHRAIEEGCAVRGYFVWSFLDNFEWAEGYDKRFGVIRVQPGSLDRVPKKSFDYLTGVYAANGLG